MDQATAVNLPSACGFAQSRRWRIASSTSASASLLVALRLQQLRHEALRPSTYPSELNTGLGLFSARHACCNLRSAVTMSSRCARSAASARIRQAAIFLRRSCKATGHGLRSRGRASPYRGKHRPLDIPDRGLLLPCLVSAVRESSGRPHPLQLTLWNYAAPCSSSSSRTHTSSIMNSYG